MIDITRVGSGSSTSSHIPGFWVVPVSQREPAFPSIADRRAICVVTCRQLPFFSILQFRRVKKPPVLSTSRVRIDHWLSCELAVRLRPQPMASDSPSCSEQTLPHQRSNGPELLPIGCIKPPAYVFLSTGPINPLIKMRVKRSLWPVTRSEPDNGGANIKFGLSGDLIPIPSRAMTRRANRVVDLLAPNPSTRPKPCFAGEFLQVFFVQR